MGLLVIEPPWWIGSRNLTDSDKRLFGVACSIKQHQRTPLPPSLSFPCPLFILPSFGLLCCHGYAQPEPSRCGTCQGAALRSPDAGRFRGGLFHTPSSPNLAVIMSVLRGVLWLRGAVGPFRHRTWSVCNFANLVFWRGPL